MKLIINENNMFYKLLILFMFCLVTLKAQTKITIANDSLRVWKNLNNLWRNDSLRLGTIIFIKGISNDYDFPKLIQSKKKNISCFDNKTRIVKLSDGIYISSILMSGTNRLFLFCKDGKIEIIPDFDVLSVLENYANYCKSSKYSNNRIIKELQTIIFWLQRSKEIEEE